MNHHEESKAGACLRSAVCLRARNLISSILRGKTALEAENLPAIGRKVAKERVVSVSVPDSASSSVDNASVSVWTLEEDD